MDGVVIAILVVLVLILLTLIRTNKHLHNIAYNQVQIARQRDALTSRIEKAIRGKNVSQG